MVTEHKEIKTTVTPTGNMLIWEWLETNDISAIHLQKLMLLIIHGTSNKQSTKSHSWSVKSSVIQVCLTFLWSFAKVYSISVRVDQECRVMVYVLNYSSHWVDVLRLRPGHHTNMHWYAYILLMSLLFWLRIILTV